MGGGLRFRILCFRNLFFFMFVSVFFAWAVEV